MVPESFPDQFYMIGREVVQNKIDFFLNSLTHGNLSKQTVGREVKKIKWILLLAVRYILKPYF